MKIIGRMEPKFTGDTGHIEDPEYLSGSIVALTKKEVEVLRLLQDAWNGEVFEWFHASSPDDKDMSDAFRAILNFVEIKFAINEFKEAINNLDNILIKGEE
jgi:hypothetical protein